MAVQERGERRRRSLLEATLRVIGARGAGAVSHRSVAEEAGVPLGSTTYYFRSRYDILVQALRHAAATETEDARRRADELRAGGLDAAGLGDALLAWLDGRLRGRARSRAIAIYALQLEAMHRPELRDAYRDWTVATVRLAHGLLEAAGAPDPAADAPALVAALDGLRHNQLATRDRGIDRAVARAVVEPLVERMLAGPFSPPR